MVVQRKVLLVDDSELALVTVTGVLEDAGYEVRATDDVQRLDAVLGDWRPDIILTDVNMPGISGVDLCRMLKASYETAHVPVVLFSVEPNDVLAQMARNCEADGFLSKANGLIRLPDELALLLDNAMF
jgi:two-component system alkaline phosphatase synthesis response regulator PhoP